MIKIIKYQCPVCKNYTLDYYKEYDICQVCGWEDDGSEKFPDDESGPNHITFNEAKRILKSGNSCLKDLDFIRKPLGIEIPKGSKEYLEIQEYFNNPINSYNEAIKLLNYDDAHKTIGDSDFLDAQNKAFTIFNTLAFTDSEIGKKSAIRLALCYANGYGCERNLYVASSLVSEVEELYNTPLKNVSIKHINGSIDRDIITIKMCDKTNPKYLKVITDLLSKKLDSTKFGTIKCNVVGDNSISVEINQLKYLDAELLKDIKTILIDFMKIQTVVVDPKAFNNPHEGVAYFNGANNLIKSYFK